MKKNDTHESNAGYYDPGTVHRERVRICAGTAAHSPRSVRYMVLPGG